MPRPRPAGDHRPFPSEAAIPGPKRQTPRLKATLAVHLPDGWKGEAIDLSAAGMRLRTMAVIAPEAVVDLEVEHQGRRVPVRMRVIWAEPGDFEVGELGELGLEVVEVSDAYLQLAAELFAND